METIIKKNVKIRLVGIDYKETEPVDGGRITAQDFLSIGNVEKESAELLIERKIHSRATPGFILSVKAKIVYAAEDGVDLREHFTNQYVKENINNLAGFIMGYISALITQITSSFGNYPLITPVMIMEEQPKK